MNNTLNNPNKINTIAITILVDDISSGNLQSEHGLSVWLEYEDKRILFDTGQTALLLKNAEFLGIDLTETDAIVISHGHYDHTGGLQAVLNLTPKAALFIHPEALKPKFSRKNNKTRMIGAPHSAKETIRKLADKQRIVWTERRTEIFPGLFVTGSIPRTNSYEDTGGDFFRNQGCNKEDDLPDDQAIFFETNQGLVVLLGCAHAGIINTLNYVTKLTGNKNVYTVLGGFHLLNASAERLEQTVEALKNYNIRKIAPAHCTGAKSVEIFKKIFSSQFCTCAAGSRISL